ncbi:RHS repeat domain-containing protein [Flavobacterium cheonhonense]|uniref:RHS repeat domain-containing protein n=1 Tax=Flavobacterium cheonhonense TaxID=706185 RepID=UPI002D76C0B6|nr:RHS repeat-associated core domain-containing protein [Flavobacterium cheonhonense]
MNYFAFLIFTLYRKIRSFKLFRLFNIFTKRSLLYDYTPFGSLVPNRHRSTDDYRYGFQGQEKDDELKGEGNSLNYTFRMHDPRVGRFFTIDPLFRDYPQYTPYSFSGNKVINAVEIEGLEEQVIVNNTNGGKRTKQNYFVLNGKTALADDFIGPVIQSLKDIDLVNNKSKITFVYHGFTTRTVKSGPWYWRSMDTYCLAKYDIHLVVDGVTLKIPVELNTGEGVNHPGGNALDYALLTVGSGVWGELFEKAVKVKVQQAIVKHFTGILAKEGVKFTIQDIIKIGRNQLNKIVFLEKGNAKAGLEHIMKHADDFSKNGIAKDDIADFVFDATTKGKIVGYQGEGTGRPIYEYLYKGEVKRVAVTTSENGFIVGANPVSVPKN